MIGSQVLSLPATVADREVDGVKWQVAHPFVVQIVEPQTRLHGMEHWGRLRQTWAERGACRGFYPNEDALRCPEW